MDNNCILAYKKNKDINKTIKKNPWIFVIPKGEEERVLFMA